MFVESPELYDAIYHFKNYARECEILRAVISVAAPGARTVLDVACGTGQHDKFLKDHYAVDGIDINENYLHAAREESRRPLHVRRHDRLRFGDDLRCGDVPVQRDRLRENRRALE